MLVWVNLANKPNDVYLPLIAIPLSTKKKQEERENSCIKQLETQRKLKTMLDYHPKNLS